MPTTKHDVLRYLVRQSRPHDERTLLDLLETVDADEEGFANLEEYREEKARRYAEANPAPPDAKDDEITRLQAEIARLQAGQAPSSKPEPVASSAADVTAGDSVNLADLSDDDLNAELIRRQALTRVQTEGPQTAGPGAPKATS